MHRDFKPANILLTEDYGVRVCDFGFARQLHAREVAEYTTYVVTRWYRAPEILVSDSYGPKVDVWALGERTAAATTTAAAVVGLRPPGSLPAALGSPPGCLAAVAFDLSPSPRAGCLLCEMLGGRPLFPGKSSADQLWLVMRTLGGLPPRQAALAACDKLFVNMVPPTPMERTSLANRFPQFSEDLLELLHGCLALDPSQRMSAEEVLAHPFFADVPLTLQAIEATGRPASEFWAGVEEAWLAAVAESGNTVCSHAFVKTLRAHSQLRTALRRARSQQPGVFDEDSDDEGEDAGEASGEEDDEVESPDQLLTRTMTPTAPKAVLRRHLTLTSTNSSAGWALGSLNSIAGPDAACELGSVMDTNMSALVGPELHTLPAGSTSFLLSSEVPASLAHTALVDAPSRSISASMDGGPSAPPQGNRSAHLVAYVGGGAAPGKVAAALGRVPSTGTLLSNSSPGAALGLGGAGAAGPNSSFNGGTTARSRLGSNSQTARAISQVLMTSTPATTSAQDVTMIMGGGVGAPFSGTPSSYHGMLTSGETPMVSAVSTTQPSPRGSMLPSLPASHYSGAAPGSGPATQEPAAGGASASAAASAPPNRLQPLPHMAAAVATSARGAQDAPAWVAPPHAAGQTSSGAAVLGPLGQMRLEPEVGDSSVHSVTGSVRRQSNGGTAHGSPVPHRAPPAHTPSFMNKLKDKFRSLMSSGPGAGDGTHGQGGIPAKWPAAPAPGSGRVVPPVAGCDGTPEASAA